MSLFLDRGREKERERNINVWLHLAHPHLGTWPATQACALTGNQTCDSLVCRPVLNPLSYTSQVTNIYIFFICMYIHIQLTFEQHGFELHRSIYRRIFSIDPCSSNACVSRVNSVVLNLHMRIGKQSKRR